MKTFALVGFPVALVGSSLVLLVAFLVQMALS
jgi:hypothetical protein